MKNDAGASGTTRILVLNNQENYLDLIMKKKKKTLEVNETV